MYMEDISEANGSYGDHSMAHRTLEIENPKRGIKRGIACINGAEIDWVEATWTASLHKKKPIFDTKEKRVTLWNKIEKRKLSGNAAPFESNVAAYLLSNPVGFKFLCTNIVRLNGCLTNDASLRHAQYAMPMTWPMMHDACDVTSANAPRSGRFTKVKATRRRAEEDQTTHLSQGLRQILNNT